MGLISEVKAKLVAQAEELEARAKELAVKADQTTEAVRDKAVTELNEAAQRVRAAIARLSEDEAPTAQSGDDGGGNGSLPD